MINLLEVMIRSFARPVWCVKYRTSAQNVCLQHWKAQVAGSRTSKSVTPSSRPNNRLDVLRLPATRTPCVKLDFIARMQSDLHLTGTRSVSFCWQSTPLVTAPWPARRREQRRVSSPGPLAASHMPSYPFLAVNRRTEWVFLRFVLRLMCFLRRHHYLQD